MRFASRFVFKPRICPHCGKQFVPGPAGMNLVFVTMRRCAHCGRWVNINKARIPEEKEERKETLGEVSEDEALRRRIEESKHE